MSLILIQDGKNGLKDFFRQNIVAVNTKPRDYRLPENVVSYLSMTLAEHGLFENATTLVSDASRPSARGEETGTLDKRHHNVGGNSPEIKQMLLDGGISKLRAIMALGRSERYDRLKSMADELLLTSGFFYESLEKRGLGNGYYTSLGEEAYHNLFLLKKGGCKHLDPASSGVTFSTIGKNFRQITTVLREVADLIFFLTGRVTRDLQEVSGLLESYRSLQRSSPDYTKTKEDYLLSFEDTRDDLEMKNTVLVEASVKPPHIQIIQTKS